MAFFKKARRELISKTLMSLVQILVAAGAAGELFIKSAMYLKILVIVSVIVLFALSVFICPEKEEE